MRFKSLVAAVMVALIALTSSFQASPALALNGPMLKDSVATQKAKATFITHFSQSLDRKADGTAPIVGATCKEWTPLAF
jgi:hypothetical protein